MAKFWQPGEWNQWAKRKAASADASVGEKLRVAGFDPKSPIWHGAVAVLAELGDGLAIEWEPLVPRDDDLWGELTVEGDARSAAVCFPAEVLGRVDFRGVEIEVFDEGDPVSYSPFVATAERVSELGRFLRGEGTVADLGEIPHATIDKVREWLTGESDLHANDISKQLYERFDLTVPAPAVESFLRRHRIER